MRDYGKVSPKFWTGATGKALRARGSEAVIVAVYLMTSPHSNMLGLFYQPRLYMAHETGLGIEGASKGLQACIEVGFCAYDEVTEMVWILEMASYQIADVLKESDKRCQGVQKEYDGLPENPFLGSFFDRYSGPFHMVTRRRFTPPWGMGSEAPSMPLASQEQEQEQEQDQEKEPYGSVGKTDAMPSCQTEKIVELYHAVLPELPKVKLMNDKRKKAIAGFWRWVLTSKKPDGTRRATTSVEALEWMGSYFGRARHNDFLMGRGTKAPGHEGWECSLDFLLTDKGMQHVIEKTKEPA